MKVEIPKCSSPEGYEHYVLPATRESYGGEVTCRIFFSHFVRCGVPPIVAAAAILSLTLGLGAGPTLFALVNSLTLGALPVAEPERMVTCRPAQRQAKQP